MKTTGRIALSIIATLAVGCSGDDDVNNVIAPVAVEWTLATDDVGDALMISPVLPLRGASIYAIVATDAITDEAGNSFSASVDFAAAANLSGPGAGSPTILFSDDLDSPNNPYPDARLVRDDGTVRVPERFALRGVPNEPAAEEALRILRNSAAVLEQLDGYSTTAPIRVALSASPDLSSVDTTSLFLFERTDGAFDLEGLLQQAELLGITRDEVAVAFSFPTQTIEDDLLAVQRTLRERAANLEEPFNLDDPDPDDDLPLGVFTSTDPEFAGFFARSPNVAIVVAGTVLSPDFRGEDGIWVRSRLDGTTPAPEAELDFLLTLPVSGSPPYPVVLVQHGFGGDNGTVLDLAELLAAEGLAAIGIDAVAHGRRGSPLSLLRARPFRARDLFRQTIADQMTVLRAIEAGVDIDGDGRLELDASRMSYIGISLGGMLGSSLVAVEEILPTAVLNVGGGRVAFLGQAPGLIDLVQGELATEVGLDREDPIFVAYIQRVLEMGQHAVDPTDGANFARHWFLEPFEGQPERNILLQQGIGDELVTPESTDALAIPGGLVSNTPMQDEEGVSGIWRFDPPGGHGILGRDDVRAQAVRFLASDGTEIIDPGEGG